ncbi:MAG: hypothetical protein RMJ28_06535 [Nitrososphaerota archaeon]|nr:hypothetical protein [Candidatus Calditenuaceae archaeon]MDW8073872.1 hypothetical protein [Nitrososphaerota archaeon]
MSEPLVTTLKYVRTVMVVSIGLAVVAAVASVSSQRALFAFGITTVIVVLFALLTVARVSGRKELKALGEASIQGLWVTTSLGLVYLTLATAPYYGLPIANAAVIALAGAITTIFSGLTLYRVSKLTGVMLSI